ncbi:MAG: hypothetical protein J0H01_22950 [Rhizobiales bacterium]|nr:hypothetical protein [Hyphomicrobiales bacterium]
MRQAKTSARGIAISLVLYLSLVFFVASVSVVALGGQFPHALRETITNWFAPTELSRTTISSLTAKPTITLYEGGRSSEYERFVVVSIADKTQRLDVFDPFWESAPHRLSIYSVGDDQIAILRPQAVRIGASLSPLQRLETFSLPADRWIYLGAFDAFRDGRTERWRFVGAEEQVECIPIRMDGFDLSDRREHHRKGCPLLTVR